MKSVLAFCILWAAGYCNPVKPARVSYSGHKLVSVKAMTPLEVAFLRELEQDPNLNLDFWKEPMRGQVDIHVDPQVYNRFTQTMQRAGMTFNVIEEDIQQLIDKELSVLSSHAGTVDYTSSYLSLSQIDTFLTDLETEFPQRVERFDLDAMTYEGRKIWGVKVSTNLQGSGKKAAWVEAGTHAREFIVISVALGTIDRLARLYNDSSNEGIKATAMLDMYDWYFVPVHNPDGYDYAYFSDRLWRKNRKRNNGQCYGVDLNRNWDVNFGGQGSSKSPCSQTYCGKKALDQPESSALDNAVKNTNDVVAYITLHSYSQLILLPWGYTTALPPDYNTLLNIGVAAEQELESYYGTQYEVGSIANILYIVSGGSKDHMKLNNGIKYTFGYELRPKDQQSGGFVLPVSQIPPTIVETFASIWKMAEQIYADDAQAGRK